MVLHESVSPTLKKSVDSLGYHAEPIGSARLAEYGRSLSALLVAFQYFAFKWETTNGRVVSLF